VTIGGENATIERNRIGIGSDGSALPTWQAIRVTGTGTGTQFGGGTNDYNVICSSTSRPAIEIDGGDVNHIGRNFIGQQADGSTCPGAGVHSAVRVHNDATGNVVGFDEASELHVGTVAADAFVVSGDTSIGNDFRYFSVDQAGEQILDIGPGLDGDGPGNGTAAGGIDAPVVTQTSTTRVMGTSAIAGSRVWVMRTTSSDGMEATQVDASFVDAVDPADPGWRVAGFDLGNGSIGDRLVAMRTLADGTSSELALADAMLDGSAPLSSIVGGPSGLTADNTPTFTMAADEAVSKWQCVFGTVAPFEDCSNPYTSPPLADGTYTFKARGVDLGNLVDTNSTAQRTFTVDTTPPPTNLTAAASGTIRTTAASFTFDAGGEAGATFECRLDSASFTACTSPFTLAGLAQGSHTVEVRALDALGNPDATPAAATFAVDSLAPKVTFLPAAAWRADARGRVIPRLACVDTNRPCTGTITVASTAKLRLPNGTRKVVTFASRKYSLATGARTPVTLTLSRANRTLLAALGSVKVRVTIVARDSLGNAVTTRKVVTLRPPLAPRR
jgi:hypothetical protein